MPDIDAYQTEHLFLLIGGNPLPNFVAAKLLAKMPNAKPTIHLVFSQGKNGTEQFAKNLRRVLGENNYDFKDLPINPARQFSIYNSVKNRIESLIQNGATSVGLNYTGGTKAMAVHAYRAIKENCGNLKPVFSYLDSREMKMCIDQENNADRVEFELYDIGSKYFYEIDLKIDDLLKLHDLEKKRSFRVVPKHEKVMTAIYEEVTDNLNEWESFRSQITGQQVSLNGLNFLPYTLNSMGLIENGQLDFAKFSAGRKAKDFRDYLNGKWLEDFVLEQIIDLKKSDNQELGEFGASLEIKHPKNSSLPYFEADCFVIRGYQLFVISCSYIATTQTLSKKKSPYKQKIFEVLSRAEQIGGSEARIALVCLASNAETHEGQTVDLVSILEQELDDERVKVLGLEDILDKKRFSRKLSEWFEKR
jgi:hypothetical protein